MHTIITSNFTINNIADLERSTDINEAIGQLMVEHKHDLDLDQAFTSNGTLGYCCVENCKVDELDEDSEFIEGVFNIEFEESYYNGCRDLEWEKLYIGEGTFRINRITHSVDIEIEATEAAQEAPDSD